MDGLFPLLYPGDYEAQSHLDALAYRAVVPTTSEAAIQNDRDYVAKNTQQRLLFTTRPLHPDLDFQEPDFWPALKNAITHHADSQRPCQFMFWRTPKKFLIESGPLGSYCRSVHYLKLFDTSYENPCFVLRAIKMRFGEGESLTKLARFPKKGVRALVWRGKHKSPMILSLMYCVHERIWHDQDITYMLLHCAKGKNLFKDYWRNLLEADTLDLSAMKPIYFKLGILLGQFFKRYLPSNPIRNGGGFHPTIIVDLNPPNIFYNPQTEKFEMIDLSDLGDSINSFSPNGMRYSMTTLLMFQIFGEVFLDTGDRKTHFYRNVGKDPVSLRNAYNEIRQFYEIICDGFIRAWYDQPDTIRLIKEWFKESFVFPYRSDREAFDPHNPIRLKKNIIQYIKMYLKYMYG